MDKKELLELIENIKKDKGGNLKDYMEFISFIGHLESKNDPNAIQKGSEIGKGAFQFEDTNGSNRILTAANRTKNYYKSKGILDSMPSFVNNILEKGTEDATNLSYNQQSLLLLGDARMGAADLKNYVGKGKDELSDYWATYHWAGHKGLETAKKNKINSFSKHIDTFYKEKDHILNKVSKQVGINDLYSDRSTKDILKENDNMFNKLDNTMNRQSNENNNLNRTHTQDNLNRNKFTSNNKEISNNQSLEQLIQSQIPSKTNQIPSKTNQNALGGITDGSKGIKSKNLNEFNTGGLHSENRLGGIPIGKGANGKTNTVEEDETSFETSKGKFIFSNRIKL